MRTKRATKPYLTDKILDGINSCTSAAIAGIGDGGILDESEDEILAADAWVKAMIRHRQKKP